MEEIELEGNKYELDLPLEELNAYQEKLARKKKTYQAQRTQKRMGTAALNMHLIKCIKELDQENQTLKDKHNALVDLLKEKKVIQFCCYCATASLINKSLN